MTRDDRGHVGELLDAWRTGELQPAEGERIETHLAGCERCREELAALEPLAATFERGFVAGRRQAEDLEPDWAAQRAAIVARTSGRPPAAGRRRAFWRWAPQLAAAAVAAIVIGVVWREAGEEPDRVETPVASRSGMEPVISAGAEERAGADDSPRAEAREADARLRDRAAAPVPAAPPAEDRLAEPRAADLAAAKAGARPEDEAGEALEKEDLGRQEQAANAAALADRAEPSREEFADDLGRFERAASSALAARDTLAARRALVLWSDTLAPRLDGAAAGPVALADSLEAMLAE